MLRPEILKKLDTMIQGLSPLKDLVVRVENIELLTEQATKRAMMGTLPDPREAVFRKRRKVISMPRTMEEEPVLDASSGRDINTGHRDRPVPARFWTYDGQGDGLWRCAAHSTHPRRLLEDPH